MPKKKAEIAETVEASEVREEYKAEPVKKVSVRILASKGSSALIEWFVDGSPRRGFVTRSQIEQVITPMGLTSTGALYEANPDVLARAIPYGLDFASLNYPAITPADVQEVLHRHGIWTANDIRTMGVEFQSAIQDVRGPILSIILNYIKGK